MTVPQGARTLEVGLGGLAAGSQTRFISVHPYGVAFEDTASTACYPNYNNPANTCRPDVRSYANPQPGVWEIEVESRRTSPLLDNPFKLDVTLLGATFDPAVKTLPEAKIGTPATVDWKVTNDAAALEGKLKGGSLGSAKTATPTIAQDERQVSTVTVGAGVERLDVVIGNTSDKGADLDLTVIKDGKLVGQSADGDSEESVSVANPAAGTYTDPRRRLRGGARRHHVRLPGRVLLLGARHRQGRRVEDRLAGQRRERPGRRRGAGERRGTGGPPVLRRGAAAERARHDRGHRQRGDREGPSVTV